MHNHVPRHKYPVLLCALSLTLSVRGLVVPLQANAVQAPSGPATIAALPFHAQLLS